MLSILIILSIHLESSVSDDLETLEQKKARLLMKLGEDFKLSPEEDSSDDSEGMYLKSVKTLLLPSKCEIIFGTL